MLLSISLIWSQKPTHFIYQNKNSIITNERTDLCFSGEKVGIPKWQGSTCQFIPQNHKHNLYFHLNRCSFSLWTIANWSLLSTHAQTHKNTHTKTLCFLFNWKIRFVFVWLSNHPKCRFGNHIQVVGVSREKKPLSLMFKVKIIRNFSSIIRAENERDTWFYEIQLFTIMRDIQVYTRICSSIQIKSNRLYRSQIWMISANIPMFSISPFFTAIPFDLHGLLLYNDFVFTTIVNSIPVCFKLLFMAKKPYPLVLNTVTHLQNI